MVDNVTPEWLLPSNEIFPCQSPVCEFSVIRKIVSRPNTDDDDDTAEQQGTKQNSHTGHCTHTAESTGVKQKTFIVGDSVTYVIYCNNRTAATLCSVGTWFVSCV